MCVACRPGGFQQDAPPRGHGRAARHHCDAPAERCDAKASRDLTIIAGKLAAPAVLRKPGDGVAPKERPAMADGLRAAQPAQNMSADRKVKIEADLKARMAQAVATIAKTKGPTGETTGAIRKQILGVV